MDQNQEQEQVLIARNNDTGQIGAVTGLNKDGTPQMTDVKSAKLSDLVKFSKGQNPLEAFLSNFVRQCKNPSTFGFFHHPVHLEPELDKEYRGHQFTASDKEQLIKTGNLGRVVELNGKDGAKVPSFVSLDRLTNEIVSIPAERIRIKSNIGRTQLTAEEIATLRNGQPILNKEVTLRDGKTFTTTLQVNADSRSVEFVPKAWQNHKQEAGQQQKNSWTDADGNIRPIGKWKGMPFTDQQKQDYVNGKTVVLTNAVDKEGQPCTLYVKFDPKIQGPVSSTKNPDVSQTVAPSNESATQVAVNNDGKTNEATNKIKEPLQQGQTSPKNEEQQKRQKKGPKL